MRVLLDTHILIWALVAPDRLDRAARATLEDADKRVFFSAVNIWEIAIKRALDRPDFTVEPDQIRSTALDIGFEELPVSGIHGVRVRHLPPLHRDPFDRMLISQAQTEPMLLMSDDPLIARYDLPLWGAAR